MRYRLVKDVLLQFMWLTKTCNKQNILELVLSFSSQRISFTIMCYGIWGDVLISKWLYDPSPEKLDSKAL